MSKDEEEQKLKLRQALRVAGAGALTGVLLLGSAPLASADDIRDRQWALDAFAAEDIWKHSTGEGTVVAVVDSGVQASHPDLKGRVLEGKDYTGGGNAHKDSVDHGTGLAGLIAGQGHGPDGNSGVMGLAPGSKILPIKYTNSDVEYGGSVTFAEGVKFAVDKGADVINISQVKSRNADEQHAIEYAIQHDVVVVAGTGNIGDNIENFPAAYPGVVAVGGINNQGEVWEKSTWGSHTTLVAPATNNVVPSTDYKSGYAMADGTSDATAYVSAAAALVIAEHPDLTAGQVINRLVKTAKIPTGEDENAKLPDEKFGYGIVRPFRAVTYDIPAGPEEGPLAQSSQGGAAASSDGDGSSAVPGEDSASEDGSGLGVVVLPVIVVVALAVLGLVIGLVVKGQRKKRSPFGGAGPGDPGAQWQWQGMPPQQPGQQYQQQPQQFYGPPNSPPPPNHPPQQ
ncbi:type VII secretion-associated serine protease mycosin [Streptomyces sp. TR02-1]|uniref:type VII secretion-associated serine protease mycosin n=1 Tax=Streptomyces sp. TR02-1 TaxID=3385977 RepID=UPI00399F96CE